MSLVHRVAQLALGVPFVWLGYAAAAEPGGRVNSVAELGLPHPEELVRANGAAMVLGGGALALNMLPRAAAAGLVASLVPTTIAGHAFWKLDDPQARAAQRVHLLKNLSLIGGLLAVASRPRRTR
jgi:uncharacterized membrane protein YphA (DoxX/SURF4 family)